MIDMNAQELDFWEKLKRWHLDDIDICIGNGANYAATKMMLTLIDILGALYGGLVQKGDNYYVLAGGGRGNAKTVVIDKVTYEKSGTKAQFKNFVKNYMHEFYEIFISTNNKRIRAVEVLYNHFRCGLVHEGHSKYGTGIIRENNDQLISQRGLYITLNILALRDLVRKAMFNFEKDLNDNKQPERMIRWRIRYKYLMESKFWQNTSATLFLHLTRASRFAG